MKVVVQHAVADPGWRPEIMQPEHVRRFAELAEKHGYSAIGFTDHPAPTVRWTQAGGEGSADPFTSLAFCAAVTSRIRLLTFVLVLPHRNPFLLAHQVATLDVLSGGRLDLGVGTGYLKGELRALGLDPAERRARFDDVLATMQRIWRVPPPDDVTSADGFAGEGLGWSARGVHGQSAPVQQPHPPLWFHGNSPFGRERAARFGAGWIGVLTNDQLATTMRTRPLPDLVAVEAAVADLRRRTVGAGRAPDAVAVSLGGLWPMLDVRRGWDTDRLLSDAARAAEIGVDTLYATVIGDDPHAAEDTVAAFGEQVVAKLADL